LSDVLVLGGYGTFGSRIGRALAKDGLGVIVAGRSAERAEAACRQMTAESPGSSVRGVAFDLHRDLPEQLERLKPSIIVDTCGPFQERNYDAARACIAAGVHYIDLSDARKYVANFGQLDAAARAAGVLAVAGASSVPGLTSAVADRYRGEFGRIDSLTVGISAAQRASGGLATAQSIASYVGKRLAPCPGYPVRYGWQGLHRVDYPGIGTRWMADCDVPDLDLLPDRYGISSIRFSAGADNLLSHFGIWAFSWAVRLGLPIDPGRHGRLLAASYNAMKPFGTLESAMHVILRGRDREGWPHERRWYLVAREGDGPNVPCVPAILLARRLATGKMTLRGATPCVGLVSLQDYLAELAGFRIETLTDAKTG